jgi:hypothetical protein
MEAHEQYDRVILEVFFIFYHFFIDENGSTVF